MSGFIQTPITLTGALFNALTADSLTVNIFYAIVL